jgi:hypothetical protein
MWLASDNRRGDGFDRVGSRREPVTVDELSLERREERFRCAVVEALTG